MFFNKFLFELNWIVMFNFTLALSENFDLVVQPLNFIQPGWNFTRESFSPKVIENRLGNKGNRNFAFKYYLTLQPTMSIKLDYAYLLIHVDSHSFYDNNSTKQDSCSLTNYARIGLPITIDHFRILSLRIDIHYTIFARGKKFSLNSVHSSENLMHTIIVDPWKWSQFFK